MEGIQFIERVKHLKRTAQNLEENLGAVFKDNANVNACIKQAKELIGILAKESEDL